MPHGGQHVLYKDINKQKQKVYSTQLVQANLHSFGNNLGFNLEVLTASVHVYIVQEHQRTNTQS